MSDHGTHPTTRATALGAAALLCLLAASPARAVDAEWPEEFNIRDVEIVVTRTVIFCLGGSITTVRLDGHGHGHFCEKSPLGDRNPPPRGWHEFQVSPEGMLEHLNTLAAVNFFGMVPTEPQEVVLLVDDDGSHVTQYIVSTSGGTDWEVTLRIGEHARTLGKSRGWPCELMAWAERLLGKAAASQP